MDALHLPVGDGGTMFCAGEGCKGLGLIAVAVHLAKFPDSKSSEKTGVLGPGAAGEDAVKPRRHIMQKTILFILGSFFSQFLCQTHAEQKDAFEESGCFTACRLGSEEGLLDGGAAWAAVATRPRLPVREWKWVKELLVPAGCCRIISEKEMSFIFKSA